MDFFKKYVSNTLASGANQRYFMSDNTDQVGRVFYKIFASGRYNYAFMFTNIIDSTYADGSQTKANHRCGDWVINYVKALVVDGEAKDLSNCEIKSEYSVLFNKKPSKAVISGEIFYSDPVEIACEKGDYICLEIGFKGNDVPYFEEMIIPSFRLLDGKWVASKHTPLACMIGCDRRVEKRVGFLGDSITEGIGVNMNSYEHWNAKIAEMTGEQYSYWNLGIGFARAADAASNGSWLAKAKNLDVVTICLGVNDMGRYSAAEIKCNVETVVRILQDNKVRTILFTVPPFDYQGENLEKWKNVNSYILNTLSKITEVYDVVPVWGDEAPNEQHAIYGGHPNAEGSLKLAQDFVQKVKL